MGLLVADVKFWLVSWFLGQVLIDWWACGVRFHLVGWLGVSGFDWLVGWMCQVLIGWLVGCVRF